MPAFTIEIGPVTAPTPVPLDYISDAVERNKNVPLELLKYLNENDSL